MVNTGILTSQQWTLRGLSKSQNWQARPWPDWSFWKWNRLFPRVFDEKGFPLCILCVRDAGLRGNKITDRLPWIFLCQWAQSWCVFVFCCCWAGEKHCKMHACICWESNKQCQTKSLRVGKTRTLWAGEMGLSASSDNQSVCRVGHILPSHGTIHS